MIVSSTEPLPSNMPPDFNAMLNSQNEHVSELDKIMLVYHDGRDLSTWMTPFCKNTRAENEMAFRDVPITPKMQDMLLLCSCFHTLTCIWLCTVIRGGEPAAGVVISIFSACSPVWLPAAVSLSLGFLSLLPCIEMSFDPSELPLVMPDLLEPFQLGNSHAWPVKLLRLKPFFSQRRHGAPDLSRALRLAFMKPVLAFGPSLWAAGPTTGGLVVLWSIVPSSLCWY